MGSILMVVGKVLMLDHTAVLGTLVLTRDCTVGLVEVGWESSVLAS